MTKKIRSTHDEFMASMTEQQRRGYEEEYTSLLIDEMIAAAMESDDVSVRKLAKAAGLSPTVLENLKSRTRKGNFFEELKSGLEDAIAHNQNQKELQIREH